MLHLRRHSPGFRGIQINLCIKTLLCYSLMMPPKSLPISSDMKKGGRATRTKGPDGENVIKAEGCYTNTAVRRFDGGGCWQQHLQIFQAIMKSNWWTDRTAALQLFAHLEGEALNVALLMPEGERANWECLSQGLSDYYNFPGRLAVFRRRFESATRRPEMDPATFAT